MVKRISILMFSLVILFASYSCSQKSGTGPKEKEYTLKLTVDYYGNTEAINKNAISVKAYKTKEDVESEQVENEYTGLNFADETKPVSITENYEVVIILDKRLSTDSTDISGDVPDDFDSTSEKLQFTMDGDKTFGITFSEAPIPKIEYTFTAGANGKIDVVVEGGASYTIEANGSKKIEFLEADINASKVKATTTGNSGYAFEKWSYNNSTDNPLTITSAMAGTISASFKTEPTITFSIKAGTGGYIDVEIRKISDNGLESNNTVGYNSTKSISFYPSLFNTHKVFLIQKANTSADYKFTKWMIRSGTDISSDSTLEINASSPKSIDAVFTYNTPTYQTGTQPTATTSDGVNTWTMISEPAHLLWLANAVNNNNPTTAKNGKYKLAKDIDYGGNYHLPIGHGATDNNRFTGVIDGAGYSIKNAKFGMSGSGTFACTGFIGHAYTSAIISNLTIDSSCMINSSAYFVGSIVGYSVSSIYITQ